MPVSLTFFHRPYGNFLGVVRTASAIDLRGYVMGLTFVLPVNQKTAKMIGGAGRASGACPTPGSNAGAVEAGQWLWFRFEFFLDSRSQPGHPGFAANGKRRLVVGAVKFLAKRQQSASSIAAAAM